MTTATKTTVSRAPGTLTQTAVTLSRGFVVVPIGSQVQSSVGHALLTLQAELMNLGYALDSFATHALGQLSKSQFKSLAVEILTTLRQQLSADRTYTPFYRNFPQDVMEASDAVLFWNAILHYWSDGQWEPPQTLKDRGFAFENVQFKPIRLGTTRDLEQLFTDLVSLPQSLTPTDQQIVAWFVEHHKNLGITLRYPESIPFKETLCILAGHRLENVPVRSATDVLRVAVYLSGGDIALPAVPKLPRTTNFARTTNFNFDWFAQNQAEAAQQEREHFKFRRFSRAERRYLLTLLESTEPVGADLQPHLGRWLRLGERLHPGEFATKFPASFAAFKELRNQPTGTGKRTRIRTFGSLVETALAQRNWKAALQLLASRPSLLARRLDWFLRDSTRVGATLETFTTVVDRISTKVLFELWNHFDKRLVEQPRMIVLKGRRAKIRHLDPLPPLDEETVGAVQTLLTASMERRIRRLPALGKVWVDPRLKDVPLPFAMRGSSPGVLTYVRGTKIPFRPEATTLRGFVHWYDEHGTIDIDLSAGLFAADFSSLGQSGGPHISWTSLRWGGKTVACHSGDIRHRRGACAEYIDIGIDGLRENGVRYVVFEAFNYDGNSFLNVKDCVFGVMERAHPRANEVFVPKTITNCVRIAGAANGVILAAFDLEKRVWIWLDFEAGRRFAVIEHNTGELRSLLESIQHPRFSVFDLLAMHADTRGALVNDDSAEIKYCWEDFVTDYTKIASFMIF